MSCRGRTAIFQETVFSATFAIKTKDAAGVRIPLDLTGATFSLWIRRTISSADPALVQLSTATSGGLIILTPPTDGRLQMVLTKAQTSALPLGLVWADLMRTDQLDPVNFVAEPQRYFGFSIPVLEPVTRLP